MRCLLLLPLLACGRDAFDARANPFKGDWSGVSYSSTLSDLYTARVTFTESRVNWRVNRQPGLEDYLVIEGNYTQNTDSGFLIITLDKAYFARPSGSEDLLLQQPCFADLEGNCVVNTAQPTQYLVSGVNLQFNVTLADRTLVTNVNRNL